MKSAIAVSNFYCVLSSSMCDLTSSNSTHSLTSPLLLKYKIAGSLPGVLKTSLSLMPLYRKYEMPAFECR